MPQRLLAGHDLVIDGSDNFATRLAVSDACVGIGVPLLSAAAVQFQGQVGLFRAKPCYRCFVGDAFDADDCDNCAELGVLGALTGTVGNFAALLAINFIVGIGDDPAGKLHLFDGREAELARNSDPRRSRVRRLRVSLAPAATRTIRWRATSSLLVSGQSSTPSPVIRCTRLRWPPMTSPETSFATIQSARFGFRLAIACSTTCSVSAAKPMRRRGRCSLAPSSARMSRVGTNLSLRRAGAFLELVRRRLDAPVGDRRDEDRRVGGQ